MLRKVRYAVTRLEREDGQTLVEYAFILILVSVAAVGILVVLGGAVLDLYQYVLDNWP